MPTSRSLLFKFVLVLLVWILGSYATALVLPTRTMVRITQEDSFFENVTFLAFFGASAAFFYLYITQPSSNNFLFFTTKKNLFYLLLSGLFFFCGAEEISWGQRIFHTTATGMFASNLQHETTLHNLPVFVYEYYDKQGRLIHNGGLFRKLFRQENLINIFCYAWCVLVPLSAMLSAPMRRLWATLNVPMVPLWLGGLLVLNNLLLHVGRLLLPGNSELTGIKIVEIKECGLAVMFLAIGGWFLLQAGQREVPFAAAPSGPDSLPPDTLRS